MRAQQHERNNDRVDTETDTERNKRRACGQGDAPSAQPTSVAAEEETATADAVMDESTKNEGDGKEQWTEVARRQPAAKSAPAPKQEEPKTADRIREAADKALEAAREEVKTTSATQRPTQGAGKSATSSSSRGTGTPQPQDAAAGAPKKEEGKTTDGNKE